MKIIQANNIKNRAALFARPVMDTAELDATVQQIMQQVQQQGDKALLQLAEKLDGCKLKSLFVTKDEIAEAVKNTDNQLKKAILTAKKNIELFHKAQLNNTAEIITTMPGIKCWRKSVAIEKVGLYIPGGTAPLFSTVLMLAIPARIAGCKEIVMCTPADKNGKVHPAMLYAASITGVTTIIKAGGAQAIAAMAYGTKSVPQVYKILGPGNQYVNHAKLLVQSRGTAIDMPAGPSEVLVLADAKANAGFIAADLLSQAEHGPDSQVMLFTTSQKLAENVLAEVNKQLAQLPRRQMAAKSLKNSSIVIAESTRQMVAWANEYAAEHLIIHCSDAQKIADKIVNAGSVFLGGFTPESVGDYASGTNHTLPTYGYAKAYSGVSVDSFIKKITFQELDTTGLKNIGDTVITMAEAEGLQAHANAVLLRLKTIE